MHFYVLFVPACPAQPIGFSIADDRVNVPIYHKVQRDTYIKCQDFLSGIEPTGTRGRHVLVIKQVGQRVIHGEMPEHWSRGDGGGGSWKKRRTQVLR